MFRRRLLNMTDYLTGYGLDFSRVSSYWVQYKNLAGDFSMETKSVDKFLNIDDISEQWALRMANDRQSFAAARYRELFTHADGSEL